MQIEQGFMLHQRPFRERSVIAELITRQHGRLSVLVRGQRLLPRPFTLLDLAWQGRGALPHLRVCEELRVFPLQGRRLICGLYLNELVLKLLPQDAVAFEVVPILQETYSGLASGADEATVLRRAEWRLLCLVDSGLVHLDATDLHLKSHYSYDPEQGLLGPLAEPQRHSAPGVVWQSLVLGQAIPAEAWRDARDMLRALLQRHLGGKTLHSRELLLGSAQSVNFPAK